MKNRIRIGAQPLLLGLCGLAAGIVNGLLGAGSGILLAYALRALSPTLRRSSRDLLANATAIILPLSLVSFLSYLRSGALPPDARLGIYLLPGLLGGFVGGILLDKLPAHVIRRLFAGLVLVSGLIMLLR